MLNLTVDLFSVLESTYTTTTTIQSYSPDHLGIARRCAQAEVRAIIAKRREFEYLLRRRESRRQDFVRYAEHELRLESLRALRAKRLEGARQKTKKKKGASGDGGAAAGMGTASDYSCVRLVRSILNRAVAKFPGDVDLWLQYIGFAARQGQTKVWCTRRNARRTGGV